MDLSEQEIERYSRQLVIPNWGTEQQIRLKSLHVAVDGKLVTAALYLVAAGIGKLTLIKSQNGSNFSEELLAHLHALNPSSIILVEDKVPTSGVDKVIHRSEGSDADLVVLGALKAAEILSELMC